MGKAWGAGIGVGSTPAGPGPTEPTALQVAERGGEATRSMGEDGRETSQVRRGATSPRGLLKPRPTGCIDG